MDLELTLLLWTTPPKIYRSTHDRHAVRTGDSTLRYSSSYEELHL